MIDGKEMAELQLIRRIRAASKSRNPAVRLGIGDDCAVLRVPAGHEMVVTTDFCLEGRHFRRDWHSPQSAGHRCLARGLSDIAAMGGRPLAAFLSLALPKGFFTPPRLMEPNEMGHPGGIAWLDGFLEGFGALAEKYGLELAGGDTAEAPGDRILADVMVVGAVPEGKALLRSGAQVGDGIYVTGTLGGSAVELEEMRTGASSRASGPQSFPEPRIPVGVELRLLGIATSCMDLSDGLSSDLHQICEASGVGAEIGGQDLPIAPGATLKQALSGGEDYELLFTVGAQVEAPHKLAGIPVSRIGTIVAGLSVRLDGAELKPDGWEHFRG